MEGNISVDGIVAIDLCEFVSRLGGRGHELTVSTLQHVRIFLTSLFAMPMASTCVVAAKKESRPSLLLDQVS